MVRSMGQSLRVWEIPDGDTEILWTVRTVRAFMFICCWRCFIYPDFFFLFMFHLLFYVPLFMESPRIHGSLVPLKFGMILFWY